MPVILFIAKMIASGAIFAAAEEVLERLLEKDEKTAEDELYAGGIAAGIFSLSNIGIFKKAIKDIPPPANLRSPAEVADFLTQITNNKAGLAALNARLGGFAPLAIKFTKTLAKVLTKKNVILAGVALLVWKVVGWLVWLPNLFQQFLDQGVFAPEQFNAIMEAWGLPFRFPISETRAMEQALKEKQLEKQILKGFEAIAKPQDKIIIRMAKTQKPEVFVGTLYSFPLEKPEQYERKIDSVINNFNDLKSDLSIQLNEWIGTLGGRIKVNLGVEFAPFDEFGNKLTGHWVTAKLFYTRLGGPGMQIETIPLGPLDPVAFMPTTQILTTIENQINTEIKIEKTKEFIIPEGALRGITKNGDIVNIDLGEDAAAVSKLAAPIVQAEGKAKPEIPAQPAIPGAAPMPASPTTALREGDYVPGKGILMPDGTFRPTASEIAAQQVAQQAASVPFGFAAPAIPTIQPTPPSIAEFPYQARSSTGSSNLNVRAAPNTSAFVTVKLPTNSLFTVLENAGSADGFTWVKVRYGSNEIGFAAKEFLIRQ